MNDLKDLRLSIESFDTDATQFSVETAALKAVDLYGPSAQLDKLMASFGLESATALHTTVTVSNESVTGWIKSKVDALTHKVQIIANKIYAKITGADDEIKEAIRKAEEAGPGAEIHLPVSKGVALASVGVVVAAGAAVALLTKSLLARSGEVAKTDEAAERAATAAAKDKGEGEHAAKAMLAHDEGMGGKSRVRKGNREQDEGRHHQVLIHGKPVVEAGKARDKAEQLEKAGKHAEADVAHKAADRIIEDAVKKARPFEGARRETAGEKVEPGFIKELGGKLSGALAGLRRSVGNFFSVVNRAARFGQGSPKGIMDRVRLSTRYIAAMFKLVWRGLASGASRALGFMRRKASGEKHEGGEKPATEGAFFGRL